MAMTSNAARANEFHSAMLLANHSKVSLEDFELMKVLGTGAYGKVFLVRRKTGKDSGKLFAMKVIKKSAIVSKAKTTEHTITERHVLEAVRCCPFIVTMHYAFQTEAKLHLIMDYVNGGELFTHLYNREHFTEEHAKFYTAEVGIALDFLHKLGIIYRDIKLENILLDKDGHIVLTDFGLSKEFTPQEQNDGRAYSFCGTIEYMAPEIVKGGQTGHGMAVDWWSLGVLFYELVTGASPFTVEGAKNTQSEISRRIVGKQPPMPRTLSPYGQDLILRLLDKEPQKRLGGGPGGFEEIKQHPLFQNFDWDKLGNKMLEPPFKPVIKDDTDTSNFSEEFTRMLPIDSPAIIPKNAEKIFQGYSFIAPSVLFGNNAIADDIFAANASGVNRPGNASLIYTSMFETSSFHKQYLLSDEILGKGSFSICKKCVDRKTNLEYAVKIMTRRADHNTEIQSLRMAQTHPNVVKIHELHEDELHVYLVMEYLRGGELLERIKSKRSFSETEACDIMRKLVSVVKFLHKIGVVHRDLKPENLLFTDKTESAQLKLVDFGFAKIKGSQPMQTPCFTLSYAAPEILKNATGENKPSSYDESVDIWSLGVILYTMLSGKVPFQPKQYTNQSAIGIMKSIMQGEVSFTREEWRDVSLSAKGLIQGLLRVDPTKRMTVEDILSHEWITGRIEMPTTPLRTPNILDSSGNFVGKAFQVALNAYHKAARTVTLMDVASAPLAKRRKMKHSSHDRSPSTGSSGSEKSDLSSIDLKEHLNSGGSRKRKMEELTSSSTITSAQGLNTTNQEVYDRSHLQLSLNKPTVPSSNTGPSPVSTIGLSSATTSTANIQNLQTNISTTNGMVNLSNFTTAYISCNNKAQTFSQAATNYLPPTYQQATSSQQVVQTIPRQSYQPQPATGVIARQQQQNNFQQPHFLQPSTLPQHTIQVCSGGGVSGYPQHPLPPMNSMSPINPTGLTRNMQMQPSQIPHNYPYMNQISQQPVNQISQQPVNQISQQPVNQMMSMQPRHTNVTNFPVNQTLVQPPPSGYVSTITLKQDPQYGIPTAYPVQQTLSGAMPPQGAPSTGYNALCTPWVDHPATTGTWSNSKLPTGVQPAQYQNNTPWSKSDDGNNNVLPPLYQNQQSSHSTGGGGGPTG
ncbi:ribosomal protein S6 kinase alpha-5-like [Clytia hemisphaerica]|uniref:non-specific serine/threonine protein kinase n=1 Tax=Clytia hemisphaerica TaxID=252671 RepID=A0A7M5X1S9_9CNID